MSDTTAAEVEPNPVPRFTFRETTDAARVISSLLLDIHTAVTMTDNPLAILLAARETQTKMELAFEIGQSVLTSGEELPKEVLSCFSTFGTLAVHIMDDHMSVNRDPAKGAVAPDFESWIREDLEQEEDEEAESFLEFLKSTGAKVIDLTSDNADVEGALSDLRAKLTGDAPEVPQSKNDDYGFYL